MCICKLRTQGWVVERTCGDSKRAVSRGIDVHGYHLQDVWEIAVGEEHSCERELGNHQDPFIDWAKIAEERHGLNA